MKLSIISQISIILAGVIILSFFSYQTALVIGYADYTFNSIIFGWLCILLFIPFFFVAVVEYVRKVRYKFQSIDDTLSAINKSNSLVEFDNNGNIISCNEVFCKATGYSQKELIGKHHKIFMPKDTDEDEYKNFWYDLKKGRIKGGEFRRINKKGDEFWIYGNYNPINNPYGEVYRILKIASDITAKKEIEFEVAKKNGYLEHAAKILRHDMHSGINTYIPRGLRSLKRRLTEDNIKDLKIESPLKMIQEGLKHTQKVYKGVKEFTNLVKKDTQLDKQEVDVREILNSYLDSTSYRKQVVIEDLGVLKVNEPLFCTAVDNLIRNGLKYNDSSTKYINIYLEDKDTIIIKDNGRGMSQEEFLLLSQPYERRENQQEKGTGLGLNICISILEEHGYKITAEKLELGTKLRIKLK